MGQRCPLGPLGITHGHEQIRLTTTFEHIFDSPQWHDARITT
jgi:hypothetical protein